jgi:anti-anti-sigma factor
MIADVAFAERDDALVVTVAGELDLSNAGAFGADVQHRVTNAAAGVVLDLLAVTFLDSAAIQALFQLNDRLRRRNQVLVLVLTEDDPAALTLRLTGVIGAIETRDDVASALAVVAAA